MGSSALFTAFATGFAKKQQQNIDQAKEGAYQKQVKDEEAERQRVRDERLNEVAEINWQKHTTKEEEFKVGAEDRAKQREIEKEDRAKRDAEKLRADEATRNKNALLAATGGNVLISKALGEQGITAAQYLSMSKTHEWDENQNKFVYREDAQKQRIIKSVEDRYKLTADADSPYVKRLKAYIMDNPGGKTESDFSQLFQRVTVNGEATAVPRKTMTEMRMQEGQDAKILLEKEQNKIAWSNNYVARARQRDARKAQIENLGLGTDKFNLERKAVLADIARKDAAAATQIQQFNDTLAYKNFKDGLLDDQYYAGLLQTSRGIDVQIDSLMERIRAASVKERQGDEEIALRKELNEYTIMKLKASSAKLEAEAAQLTSGGMFKDPKEYADFAHKAYTAQHQGMFGSTGVTEAEFMDKEWPLIYNAYKAAIAQDNPALKEDIKAGTEFLSWAEEAKKRLSTDQARTKQIRAAAIKRYGDNPRAIRFIDQMLESIEAGKPMQKTKDNDPNSFLFDWGRKE